jgi:hypothetical protein
MKLTVWIIFAFVCCAAALVVDVLHAYSTISGSWLLVALPLCIPSVVFIIWIIVNVVKEVREQ